MLTNMLPNEEPSRVMLDVYKADPLAAKSVYLSVTIGAWGNSSSADMDEISTEADKEYLKATKMLLMDEESTGRSGKGKCAKELQAILTLDAKCGEWIKARGFLSQFRKGIYRFPIGLVNQAESYLVNYETSERAPLINELVAAYPRLIERAQMKLGPQFRVADYLTTEALRGKFYVRRKWFVVDTPDALKAISMELYNLEKGRAIQELDSELDAIRMALRRELQGLMDHMVERLTGVDDKGRPKTFRESMIGNLHSWLTMFDDRNLAQDDGLTKLVAQARGMVKGLNTDALRDSLSARTVVRSTATQIKLQLDSMVGPQKSRSITVE